MLNIFDYKFGTHVVSARRNLQLIFYAIAVAQEYHWNFKRVRLWIVQPRARGYDGPTYWELSIDELFDYVKEFRDAVKRVETKSKTYKEGDWCYFCRARTICPLKTRKQQNLIGGMLDVST